MMDRGIGIWQQRLQTLVLPKGFLLSKTTLHFVVEFSGLDVVPDEVTNS